FVVNGVSEFVQHRAHPTLVVANVAEDPNIAFMIDIEAESMLRFRITLVKIGALQQIIDIQTNAFVVGTRHLHNVGAFKDLVERFTGRYSRTFLEEWIGVQPWIIRRGSLAKLLFESRIESGFHLSKCA